MIIHLNDKMVEQCGGEEGIEKILKVFGHYTPVDKCIVLQPEDVARAQEILDKVISDGKDLVSSMEKLSQVNISGAKFNFSPDQLLRIKDQASFYSKSSKDYAVEIITNKMKEMLGEI